MSAEEKARQVLEEEMLRLFVAGEFDQAVAACDRALGLKPDFAEAWLIRGLALDKLGRYQEAVESYDEALKHRPDWAEAWVNRGAALAGLGRHQEAVESYDQALKHKPDNARAWAGRLNALQELEWWLKERLPPKPYVEAFELVAWIEERLHIFIRKKLQQVFGKENDAWWFQGVPEEIRFECATLRQRDFGRQHEYNYTYLIHLKKIMDKKGNWPHFERDFLRVKQEVKSKDELLSSLDRLNEIRNKVMHPVRGGLTEDDLVFARQMREAIEKFASLE